MKHNIAWFDIPVADLDRAIAFYSAVLGAAVSKEQSGSIPIGVLPTPDGQKMGCLVTGDAARPSLDGVMLWFEVEGRLKAALAAALANGGELLGDVHAIGGYGFRAEVRDSEGNRIALYSSKDQ
ncbi:VOC family protein [Lysobacter sp. CCNWLW3]|uniref:VOC family protein n=1 Tax=unclassified Lysobacter TaxID=2635362 RepID=UPI002FD182B2